MGKLCYFIICEEFAFYFDVRHKEKKDIGQKKIVMTDSWHINFSVMEVTIHF